MTSGSRGREYQVALQLDAVARPQGFELGANIDAILAPPPGSVPRLRLQEWLHFIATELHKAFGPINHPKSPDELKLALKERLASRFEFLAKSLEGRDYLLGETFSVADGYAYYVLRNYQKVDAPGFAKHPILKTYFERIATRPAVRAALDAENLY